MPREKENENFPWMLSSRLRGDGARLFSWLMGAAMNALSRLREFAKGSGPTLRPYCDHNGFDQHDRLRADLRFILNELKLRIQKEFP